MLKNMKIGKKLIASFLAIALLAGSGGVTAVFMLDKINSEYEDALVNYGFSQGDLGMVLTELADSRRVALEIIINADDPQKIAAYEKEMMTGQENALAKLAAVGETTLTEKGKEQLAAITANIEKYVGKRTEILNMVQAGNPEQNALAMERFESELSPIYNEVYSSIDELFSLKVTTGNTLKEDLRKEGNQSILLTIGLTVGAFLVSLVLGTAISRGISKPLSACARRLEDLSGGDLHSPVPQVQSKDEVGLLADATNRIVQDLKGIIEDESVVLGAMARGDLTVQARAKYPGDFRRVQESIEEILVSFSRTVGQIGQSASQVADGAGMMASGAQQLSQGATEQASSLQELSATVQEISQQVAGNADYARQASDMAETVGEKLMGSNQQMQGMLTAMGDISHSSNEISKIIKTIEDIAFQTNILALNAAVEAARAGAAGKGFAVVADEVRNLASKSAEASQSTVGLIENSIRAVENGSRMANDAAQSLLETVDGAKEVTSLIERISDASQEQSQAISQVTLGLDQISSVVQANSATAEESAATSEELASQSQILNGLVQQFQLEREHQGVY